MSKNGKPRGAGSGDNVVPFFPRKRDKRQPNVRSLHIEGFPVIHAVGFTDPSAALFYMMSQIVEAQNGAFDECLRRLLGHLAENENVRDVLKTWEREREKIDDMLDDFNEAIAWLQEET